MKIESLFQYLDQYLEITGFPDYSAAHNGLQVGGPSEVYRLGVAVDASEAVINEAVDRKIDLLIAHHGLFWDGRTRIVGPRFRKLRALIQGNIALYGCHLPLDAHTEVGHCAVLCGELGWEIGGRFGAYQGRDIGWWCDVDFKRDALVAHIEKTIKGPVRLISGGPEQVYRIGVVTGSAADLIPEAAGFDATYVPLDSPDSMALALRQHSSTQDFSMRTVFSSKILIDSSKSLLISFSSQSIKYS